MVFLLPALSWIFRLPPGVAGAWIGSSSFGDASGMAAAKAVPAKSDAAVDAFTIVKVVGRDMWIGLWCIALSAYSMKANWDQSDETDSEDDAEVVKKEGPEDVVEETGADLMCCAASPTAQDAASKPAAADDSSDEDSQPEPSKQADGADSNPARMCLERVREATQ